MQIVATARRVVAGVLASASVTLASPGSTTPLDLADPTPRLVVVEFETSADLSTIAAQFGESVPATYSMTGTVGTLTIAGDDFEALAPSGSFQLESSDIVIEIDTITGAAAVISASGTLSSQFGGYAWSWTLDTARTAGWLDGGGFGPLHCSSQAQVDDACLTIPALCGAICEIVPGAVYDPGTGTLNMVGFEHQDGCGETGCTVVDFFTGRGDLRLSELAASRPLPALSQAGRWIGSLTILYCGLLAGRGARTQSRSSRAGRAPRPRRSVRGSGALARGPTPEPGEADAAERRPRGRQPRGDSGLCGLSRPSASELP